LLEALNTLDLNLGSIRTANRHFLGWVVQAIVYALKNAS